MTDKQAEKLLVAARHQAKFIEDIFKQKNVAMHSPQQGLVEVSQPSFLAAFYETTTPVVVVSAKKSEQVTMAPTSSKTDSGPAQMLEVTGTPLEAPFSAEDLRLIDNVEQPVVPEQTYHPLDTDFARLILLRYAEKIGSVRKHHKISSDDIVPVFMICNGTDGLNYVLLVSESNGTSRASRMFAEQEEKCEEKKMVDLRKKAQQMTRVYVSSGGKPRHVPPIQTERYLEFSGLQRQVILDDGSKLEEDIGFRVKTNWKLRGDNLDAPVPLGAVCTLEYFLDREFVKLETGGMLAEISLLLQLTEHLEKASSDLQLTFVPGFTSDLDPVDLARDIMSKCRAATATSNTSKNEVPLLVNLLAAVEKESRPNMDLTDIVWNSFKHIKSLSSVTECLQAVIREYLTSKPYLQPNNPTKLAKMFHKLLDNGDEIMLFLSSTPQLVVEMLLEIGYTKLCRDLVYICEASSLHSGDATREACGVSLSNWPEKLQRLVLMHRVMELMLRAQECLGVSLDALRLIIDKALQMKPRDTLRVNLKADHLESFFTCSQPVVQRWSFKSFNVTTKSTVNAHFVCSQHPIFPWLPPQSAGPKADPDSTLEQQAAMSEVYCATLFRIVNP